MGGRINAHEDMIAHHWVFVGKCSILNLFIYLWVLIFKIREWTAVIWVGATSFGVVKRGTISYAVCKSSAFQNLDPLAVRSLLTPIVLLAGILNTSYKLVIFKSQHHYNATLSPTCQCLLSTSTTTYLIL